MPITSDINKYTVKPLIFTNNINLIFFLLISIKSLLLYFGAHSVFNVLYTVVYSVCIYIADYCQKNRKRAKTELIEKKLRFQNI